MSTSKNEFAEKLKILAEHLDTCEGVRNYDVAEGEKEAWTLSHGFLDLAQSFRVFLDYQLPKLQNEHLEPDQIQNLLLDIGEEFRHILYHINDLRFYGYLRD